MSAYLLDTNSIIAFTRAPRTSPISERCRRAGASALRLSSVVLHELYFGAYNGESSMLPRNLAVIQAIDWQVAEFSAADAHAAGMLRSLLRGRGRPIGSYDLLIAAQAMARGWTVVTNNMREFNRIDGLRCEDWTVAAA